MFLVELVIIFHPFSLWSPKTDLCIHNILLAEPFSSWLKATHCPMFFISDPLHFSTQYSDKTMGCNSGESSFDSRMRQIFFTCPQPPHQAEDHADCWTVVTECSSAGRKADHSPTSSAKCAKFCVSSSSHVLHRYILKQKTSFQFLLYLINL